jgi:cytidylate kinase
MALELTVNNSDEFEDLINSQGREVSEALVETILKNLKGRKRHLHVLSVAVVDEGSIYDITVDREDFKDTLNKQLPILEKHELYEMCAEVVKALKYLEEKKK